jgi:lipopolysaccharide exporter
VDVARCMDLARSGVLPENLRSGHPCVARAVSGGLAQRAGDALAWKAFQLAGVKGVFLLRTVVLARLLLPDDFGLLAIATAAVGAMMSLTELGMTPALVYRDEIDEAHYDTAWTLNVLRGVCVSVVLVMAAPAIAAVFAEPRAIPILRVLALKPLIDAFASTKLAALMRTLVYRRLAVTGLLAAAIETVVSVVLANSLGVWALVCGSLAAAAAATVFSYVVAPHRPRLRLSRRAMRPLIRYGRWVFLNGLSAMMAGAITQVVIARRLGAVELGLYFLAAKLAFLPHEVASQVVGDVAFSLFARVQNERTRVARTFRSVLLGSAALLLPVYALLFSLAPTLVSAVLGEHWRGTEQIIQVLAITGVVGLFGDASGPLFKGLGYPQWILAIEAWQSSVAILLLWTLTGRYGVLGAALAWVVAVGSAQMMSFGFARRILQRPLAGSALPLAITVVASLLAALTAVVITLTASGATGLVMATTAALLVAAVVLWIGDSFFDLELRADLTRTFPQVASLVRLASSPR